MASLAKTWETICIQLWMWYRSADHKGQRDDQPHPYQTERRQPAHGCPNLCAPGCLLLRAAAPGHWQAAISLSFFFLLRPHGRSLACVGCLRHGSCDGHGGPLPAPAQRPHRWARWAFPPPLARLDCPSWRFPAAGSVIRQPPLLPWCLRSLGSGGDSFSSHGGGSCPFACG